MNLSPNSKLVCIDASPPPDYHLVEHDLVEGALYNIELVDPPRWDGDEYGVRVTGHKCWVIRTGKESLWRASRFRRPHRSQDLTVDLSRPKPEPVESGFDVVDSLP